MDYFDKARQFVIDSFSKPGGAEGLRHFDRTVYWLEQLKPDADDAFRIAAVAHDIERAYRDSSVKPVKESEKGFRDDFYLTYHPEKGAEIIGDFLKREDAPDDLIERVTRLVSKHEVGGDEDQNLLKDADSISYFENYVDHFLTKEVGLVGIPKIRKKFDWMFERITSPKAREIAKPMYEEAIRRLEVCKG